VVGQVPELSCIGRKALDIGCGEGTLAAELSAAGWPSVAGLDISRTRVFRARQLHPELDFYDQPLDETEIAFGSIDLVTMDNVIEHLPNPVTTLNTIRSILNSEGRLIVITPNMESGHFRLLGRRWTQELAPHAHIFLFTDGSLRRLLTRTGFVVEASGTFHLSPYSWRLWLKMLNYADVKGLTWSAVQELGGFFGRLIGSGPMIYAVARIASAHQIANQAFETCCHPH
jgi:2-polyprenyl-3-methyl-5-hydroxy-6-metoxy-1,4-benzoquinol methylase